MVEDGLPDGACVGGFPYAAVDTAEVVGGRTAGYAADSDDAAGAEGSDETPLQAAEELRRDRLGGERQRQG